MNIAIINEITTASRNGDIFRALSDRGHRIINLGMKSPDDRPQLNYLHTGIMSGLLLNLNAADLVIGGCGTGQGFAIAAMQLPGVFCGQVRTPLDAWLFAQINGGNCISLMLNQEYGFGGDVNLRLIFDSLFSVESGCGYPDHRKAAQGEARQSLKRISECAHRVLYDIVKNLPADILKAIIGYPPMQQCLAALPDSDSPVLTLLR